MLVLVQLVLVQGLGLDEEDERRNVGFVWRECALDQNSAKMTIHRYTITYDHGECHGEGMDHDGNVEYKGQITLSYPPARHGLGKSYVDNKISYEGEWKYDQEHGNGKQFCTTASGVRLVYDGEWKEGLRDGLGIYFGSSNLPEYEGGFVQGMRHGVGKELDDRERVVYDGEWEYGMRHGLGKSYCDGNLEYSGEWKHDSYHGQGMLFSPSQKLVYDGAWVNHEQHGKGNFYHAGTERNEKLAYTGEYKEGKRCGKGTYFTIHGAKRYEGDWKNDTFDGVGTLFHAKDLIRYKGGFKNGCFEGEGALFGENGLHIYVGSFMNGQYHGAGHFFAPDDTTFSGSFDRNQFKKGDMFGKGAKLIYSGDMKMLSKDAFELTPRDSGAVRLGRIYEELPYEDIEHPCIVAHGSGTWYTPTGSDGYTGHFKEGLFHGKGEQYDANGTLMYKGEWDRGRRHGLGESHVGDYSYNGSFQDGHHHGMGKYFYKNALTYEGEWKEGRQIGLCIAGMNGIGVYNEQGEYDWDATRKRVREFVEHEARAFKVQKDGFHCAICLREDAEDTYESVAK